MRSIGLFLTLAMSVFLFSYSSSDDGMKSNERDVIVELVNTNVVVRSSVEYTSFNYNVKSSANIPLDGRVEVTTIKDEKYQSDYFTISPNGTVKTSVLVKGKVEVNYVKSHKAYTRTAKGNVNPAF